MKKVMIIIAVMLLFMVACDNGTGNVVNTPNNTEEVTGIEKLYHNGSEIRIYYFWGDGCPVCAQQAPFLDRIEEEYEVEILRFEIYYDRDNQQLFRDFGEVYGIGARGVPTTFIGERSWIGFSSRSGAEMESKIVECLENGCEDPFVR